MKRILTLMLVVLMACTSLAVPTASANADLPTVKITSLKFSKPGYRPKPKSTVDLFKYLTVRPSNASKESIRWHTTNAKVVSVDELGVITIHRDGRVRITAYSATNQKIKASCIIEVKAVRVKSFTLSKSSAVLKEGESLKLTGKISPSNATYKEVEWAIDNPAIASVGSDGTITALKPGKATITFKTDKGRKSAKFSLKVHTSDMSKAVRVTITAAGDITIGGDPRKSASTIGSQGYYDKLYKMSGGKFLSNAAPYFQGKNNVSIVNLETSFSTSSRYKNKNFVFRAKPSYASMLSGAGVDIVGHANNHAEDCSGGISSTRSAVKSAGMQYVGNGTFGYAERDGVRIGFCAYNGSNSNMRSTIKKLKQSCDLVVVSIHWGKEWVYAASSSQRSLGRSAISAGADLVVGHHSHVVSGIEKYKGKYIVYGLGTLSSAILTPKDMDNFIYQQTFDVIPGTGQVEEGSVKLIPFSTSSDAKRNNGMATVLSGGARDRVLGKIQKYSRSFPATVPSSCFQ